MQKIILVLFISLSLLSCSASSDKDTNKKSNLQNIKLIKSKANNGDVNAQGTLGSMYYQGEGITQNYKEAFKLYTLAAEQGNTAAQGISRFYVLPRRRFNSKLQRSF